jgi:hypothetical protein
LQLRCGVRPRTTPSHSTTRDDAEASDMSRVQHVDGRGRDPRPREPSDADVASRSRGGEALDRNQNARERAPAGGQLSLSQVRIPQDVRAAGVTIVEPVGLSRRTYDIYSRGLSCRLLSCFAQTESAAANHRRAHKFHALSQAERCARCRARLRVRFRS